MTETPSPFAIWIYAARPRTLLLAFATILMGAFLAAADGAARWDLVALAALTATFLQILSNLANDYGDSKHGADSGTRVGPQRAVQSGQVSPAAMKRAMGLTAALAALAGVALVWLAFGAEGLLAAGLFILLGAAAIWAAVSYTASSRPYGYAGLGDLFVLIFFGWVGVAGTYFLQAGVLTGRLLLPATAIGLLAVGVLNVNNIRDIDSDRLAGKRSVPVRLGPARARIYHWLLLGLAWGCALLFVLTDYQSPWQLLFLLATPLLVRHGLAVARGRDAAALDPLLKQLSLTTLAFVLLFGLGLLAA